MVWLWSKLRLRRASGARTRGRSASGIRVASWEPLFAALGTGRCAAGGRVLVDRPVARLARGRRGLRVIPGGEPTPSAAGTTRARFAVADEGSATTRCSPPCRTTSSRGCSTRPGGRGRRALPRPAGGHRVRGGALPAARARPPVQRASTGPTWATARCPSSGSSRRRTSSSRSATAGGASSTWRTTSRTAIRCSSSTPRGCWAPTSRGCGPSTRPSAGVGPAPGGVSPSPPPSPSSPSATRDRLPPLRTPAPRARAGQHDPGVSGGPGDELRRPARRAGRTGNADGMMGGMRIAIAADERTGVAARGGRGDPPARARARPARGAGRGRPGRTGRGPRRPPRATWPAGVPSGHRLLLDGHGGGVAANEVPGIRAALSADAATAEGARRWNDANVLAISLRTMSRGGVRRGAGRLVRGRPVRGGGRPRQRRPRRRDPGRQHVAEGAADPSGPRRAPHRSIGRGPR